MRRTIATAALFFSLTLLCACSGQMNVGSVSVGSPRSVSVSPGSAALTLGATQQFTADVMGSTDQTVQWTVNGVPGGNAASGLISEGGVYLAPTTLPASTTVTVTAVSFADPSKTGVATVMLSQNAGVAVVINGSSAATLAQTFGPVIPFTATVTGNANTKVTWEVNGVVGGAAKTGTISASGVYNPPHAVPVSTAVNNDGQTVDVIVTAVSVADPSASDSADVIIYPPQQNEQTLPTPLGVSGGNANDTAMISGQTFCCGGTIGSEVVREGQKYILSNNHVLARSDLGVAGSGNTGEGIVQPGLIDNNCVTSGANTVANLSQFYNLESGSGTPADAAIALVVTGAVDPSGTILQLGGTNNGNQPTDGPPHQGSGIAASIGEAVAKSGRSTGLTCASVTATNIETSVEYQKSCGTGSTFTVTYHDAISIGNGTFSAEGDSGSLVVDMNTADAVGLLFAGSDTDTVANPISDVLAQMADPVNNVRPTFVGSASTHVVAACSLPGPQGGMAAALAVPQSVASSGALQEASAARNAHLAELLALPGVVAVGVGSSYDNPQEAAVLLFVSKAAGNVALPGNFPAELDGVRTRIVASEIAGQRGALSDAQSAAAEQSVAAPIAVQAISAAETARALAVQRVRAAEWLKQAGVQGVGVTSSVDAPGAAALLIFLIRGELHPLIPPVIDGLRTRVRVSSRFRAGIHQMHPPRPICGLPAKLAVEGLRPPRAALRIRLLHLLRTTRRQTLRNARSPSVFAGGYKRTPRTV